jgi:hypothetical protein
LIGTVLVALVLAGVCINGAQNFGGEAINMEGTGNYDSKVFAVNGGNYTVSWQVQQTPQGAGVIPCAIQADLWNEAGYHQSSLIWGDPGLARAAGPAEGGQVTVRIPPGRWSVEVTNSCSDSHSVIQIRSASG